MSLDDKVKHWDDMYQMPLAKIPWEIKEPPKELVKLLDEGQIKSGTALDIACGTGNYSLYLAKKGFDVTGIDFSKKAIDIAIKNSEDSKLPAHFIVGDITKMHRYLPDLSFDFILDYSILHHIELSLTNSYAEQCSNLLKPGGKLLLICYSDKDEFSSGNNSVKGTYGNTMYYRPADDISKAYKDLREISYYETRLGKRAQHMAHCFLFEKS